MVSYLVVLSLVVCVANASTWRSRTLPDKPEHLANKEGCYIKEIDDVIPFGESITPKGYCYEISCGRSSVYYDSCITVSSSDNKCHKTTENLTVPYPECCPQIICDSENNI